MAGSKKWKVYRKKKGQSRKFCMVETLKIKGYLSPPITGRNLTEIIAHSNEMQSQHIEVEVILQATSAIIKSETPEEVTGRFQIIFMCNIYFHRNMVQSECVIYLYSNFQSSSTKFSTPLVRPSQDPSKSNSVWMLSNFKRHLNIVSTLQ